MCANVLQTHKRFFRDKNLQNVWESNKQHLKLSVSNSLRQAMNHVHTNIHQTRELTAHGYIKNSYHTLK